ncbi:unnamed protein product [Adineta steineri]|uniref:RRM domain-containing protein n=1 Tax=Adineta steineri TaxID=433720 RepID=A0A819UKF9_9BILA|nr:unnamed protein product [Adineta steineri]
MANDNNQTAEQFCKYVCIKNLPFGITAREISEFFEQFGTIMNLYLKRRVAKDSPISLPNPLVTLVFPDQGSVDEIMAARPFVMGDCQLFVRRCLPINAKYPTEPFFSTRKMLVRLQSDKIDDSLPDDKSIIQYLSHAGGKIEHFERLDNKTVLVKFDDYDPVDICCLSRPHFIGNQSIEIEKCTDENLARNPTGLQQKSNFDIDNEMMDTVSPSIPILSIDDQMTQIRSTHNDMTQRLEREHEQLVGSLAAEWEKVAKKRIRLQRLTLDYKQESERLEVEKRKWQKLYSESLKEKPIIKTQGETKLSDAYQKYTQAKEKYDQLIQNIQK